MRGRRTERRRDRGAVIPMVALSLTVLMTMTAFAVDLGRMRVERRDLQADADALALDAVQMIRGLAAPAALTAAQAEVAQSAVRNGVDPTEIESVRVGRWHSSVEPPWFEEYTAANQYPDAVEVRLADLVTMFFDLSTDERRVARIGVAVSRASTMGELGSVAAGVRPEVEDPTSGCAVGVAASVQMTVMNHIYTELFGITAESSIRGEVDEGVDRNVSCQVSGPSDGMQLDAASYQGLASNRVTFRDLAAAGGAGSPDAFMDQSVTQAELLEIAAQALQSGEDPTTTRYQVGTQLIQIAREVGTATSFRVGDIFQGSTGGQESWAEASVTVIDLLFAAATAIDGNNFVGGTSGISVPLPLGPDGAPVGVPMKVHVIERPDYDERPKFSGEAGPSTSQVSVALEIPFSVSGLPIDLAPLGIPGLPGPGTANATGTLPLIFEVGKATSSYPSITCPSDGTPPVVEMAVTSGAARVRVGLTTDTDFSDGIDVNTPGSLAEGNSSVTTVGVGALGLQVSVDAQIDMAVATDVPSFGQNFNGAGAGLLDAGAGLAAGGGSTVPPLRFDFVDPGPTPYQRYRGGFGGVAVSDSVLASHSFGASSSGLLGLLTTEAASRAARNGVVQTALDPVLARLDSTVLQPVFNALGMTVGGADARIHDVRCQVPALANRGDEG